MLARKGNQGRIYISYRTEISKYAPNTGSKSDTLPNIIAMTNEIIDFAVSEEEIYSSLVVLT
jgi:hypothetical protein